MQDYDKDGTLHYQTIFIALMYSLARAQRDVIHQWHTHEDVYQEY